jgi:hypothetical protein
MRADRASVFNVLPKNCANDTQTLELYHVEVALKYTTLYIKDRFTVALFSVLHDVLLQHDAYHIQALLVPEKIGSPSNAWI